jgi:hypothetical protein
VEHVEACLKELINENRLGKAGSSEDSELILTL